MIHDIFISYRREGGVDLAARINEALKAKGYTVFMDIEDLNSGKFNVALLKKIEEATDVLIILTPGCLERCRNEGDWLLREIDHAIKHERNVVPVMQRSFVRPAPGEMPSVINDLLEYHGIISQPEMFEESMARLTRLLKSCPAKFERLTGDTAGGFVENEHSWSGPAQVRPLAQSVPARMAVLKIVSDPPGANVVIDGGKWETEAGKHITKVEWGPHAYFAILGDEECYGSFDIDASTFILSIKFPRALDKIAETATEEALWTRTVATDIEEAYCEYLTESRLQAHQIEAEQRLGELRKARALREEAEAAAERARQKAKEHEQKIWATATAENTEASYSAYVGASRLLTHRSEAEARIEQIRAEKTRMENEHREANLWTATKKEDTEKGYESYLEKSQLGTHRADATRRLDALRAERAHREEEARRQREKEAAEALARQEEERREQTIWNAASKANTEESYAQYLTESRLLTHRLEAQRYGEQLRVERIRKEEEECQRREAAEVAERAHQAALLQEPILWDAATKTDTTTSYQKYLSESILLLHKQEAQDRLTQFRDEQLRREEEEAKVRHEKEEELAREVAQQKDSEAWLQALKTDSEDGYQLYLAQAFPLTKKATAEAKLAELQAERLRKEAEDAIPAGTERTFSLAPGVNLTMCWIPSTTSSQWKQLSGGQDVFLMGSLPEEKHRRSDEDLHPVKLTKGFWMGKHPVTVAQWTAVMRTTPRHGYDGQVGGETWNACVKFIEKLNKRIAGSGFRMPTEAEWEYACRAGRTGPYAWTYENETSHVLGIFRTSKVFAYNTNPWNLKGMYEGSYEWCLDCYDKYPLGLAVDPAITSKKKMDRVLRGSCSYEKHSSGLRLARIAERRYASPDEQRIIYGFRLARTNPDVQDSAWPRTGDAEMAEWYRKAAEQGDAAAQRNLGCCYANGQGVAKNEAEAVKWYRKAADQGHAQAQCSLGYCYANGQGVAKDEAQAAKWYRKAADQGYAQAQFNLGCCYANGQGVLKDEVQAAKWYRKAADQGYAYAQNNLGRCYANGQGVAKDKTEAVKWYRKAADQEEANAQYNLGCYYANGQSSAKDEVEAVKWYRKAADQGHALAQYTLGRCYDNGTGVAKDEAEAVKWYRKAADQGNIQARHILEVRIDKDQVVAKSEAKVPQSAVANFDAILRALEEAASSEEQRRATTSNSLRSAGRNDPCPCGSGKKYKKCCGMGL